MRPHLLSFAEPVQREQSHLHGGLQPAACPWQLQLDGGVGVRPRLVCAPQEGGAAAEPGLGLFDRRLRGTQACG